MNIVGYARKGEKVQTLGGGGYSRVQVMGMIKGFLGRFEIFNSGIFWVGKFGKYFFVWLDFSRDLSTEFLVVFKTI